jgi:hypothetical protein
MSIHLLMLYKSYEFIIQCYTTQMPLPVENIWNVLHKVNKIRVAGEILRISRENISTVASLSAKIFLFCTCSQQPKTSLVFSSSSTDAVCI